MRSFSLLITGSVLAISTSAEAADQLKFGKAPAWVVPQAIPANGDAPNAPVALLLSDQQVHFEAGKRTIFAEMAMKIQKPEGLSAGNISLPWDPATDTVTVNRLEIHRGTQVIDILASQKFTTLRRESGLEAAMLDGVLTANIQPEGLQQGDTIVLATTDEHSDPVLGNHVESNFAEWPGVPVAKAHARVEWPATIPIRVQSTGIAAEPVNRGASRVVEISAENLQPIIAPKGAPVRFSVTRLGEASDFTSWADVARLMAPLYAKAAVIPASGPLHDEVEKIRNSTAEPKLRTQQALELVQDRVRYVALLMGQGGYVPADADTTWGRRFGDCKAKSVLLLAILHSLGIEAEPLFVQSTAGDAIHDRLPMISYFDHVLVRAHIGGKAYYLDGTRTGDTSIDKIDIPDFGWALPVVPDAQLVDLVPPPLDRPSLDTTVAIDATAGIYTPASVTAEQIIRGDLAVGYNNSIGSLTDAQRKEFFDAFWKKTIDDVTPGSTSFTFDKATRQLRMSMQGTIKLDWTGGFFHLPNSSIGFDPDLDRPAGPNHDAPFLVSHPEYSHTTTKVRFPASFFSTNVAKLTPAPVHQTLMGVEYSRTQSATPDGMTVETVTRSLVPEVSYKEAMAARDQLKSLAAGDVAVRIPGTYRATATDVLALKNDTSGDADDLVSRGDTLLGSNQFGDAIANYSKALELDAKNIDALCERAIAYAWSHKLSEAQADITAAQAIDPNSAAMLRARGVLAEARGQFSEAIDSFTKSLVIEPKNDFARFYRANARAEMGDTSGALADYQSASQYRPDDPKDQLYKAVVEANLGRLDDARKDMAAAVASAPSLPGLDAARAIIAEKSGDFQGAVQAYTDAIKADPGHAAVLLFKRAQAYDDLADRSKALADADAALKAGYKEVDIRLLRANLYYRLGNREATAKEAELAMSENPQSEYAFVMAGRTYARLGRTREALAAFDRAVALNPAPYVYVNRAQVRPGSDVDGQLADYDAALKLEPDQPDAINGKAQLLAGLGRSSEAKPLYEKAAQLLSRDPDSAGARAELLYRAGDATEAEQAFADARKNAKTANQLNSLCWEKATAGFMLESALDDCRQALKLSPKESSYLDSLGMVLLKLGKLDEALDAYNKAIVHGTEQSSLMGRAIVYARKGDRQRAEADAAAARKLWPEVETVFARDYGLKLELP